MNEESECWTKSVRVKLRMRIWLKVKVVGVVGLGVKFVDSTSCHPMIYQWKLTFRIVLGMPLCTNIAVFLTWFKSGGANQCWNKMSNFVKAVWHKIDKRLAWNWLKIDTKRLFKCRFLYVDIFFNDVTKLQGFPYLCQIFYQPVYPCVKIFGETNKRMKGWTKADLDEKEKDDKKKATLGKNNSQAGLLVTGHNFQQRRRSSSSQSCNQDLFGLNFTSSSCVIWCWSPNTCSPWVKVSETLVNFSLVIVTPVVRGSLANPGQITPAGPISEPTQRIATRGGPHSPVQHPHLHHPLPDNHLPTDTNKGVIWPLNNFRGMTVEEWSNTQRRTNCENILVLFLGFNATFRYFQVNLRHFSHGLLLG